MKLNCKTGDPRLKYLGEITFLALGILAYIFYLERTIILNTSTYRILKKEDLSIKLE